MCFTGDALLSEDNDAWLYEIVVPIYTYSSWEKCNLPVWTNKIKCMAVSEVANKCKRIQRKIIEQTIENIKENRNIYI